MKQSLAQELLTLVKRNYQEIAVNFDITRQKELRPEIKRLADKVPDGAKVLDAGCGNGRLLKAFVNRSIDYWGIDNSAQLLAQAQRQYPKTRFRQLDILELDQWPEKDFTQIFCLAVLQHIPSQRLRRLAWQELAAKLAPGGRLIISNWNLRAQSKFRTLLFQAWWSKLLGNNKLDRGDLIFPWKNSQGEVISQRYYHAFTLRELRHLSRTTDLKIIESFSDVNHWLILEKQH